LRLIGELFSRAEEIFSFVVMLKIA